MSDKIFVDTNIFVYAYTNGNAEKHEIAKKVLQNSTNRYIISTQTLNEFGEINVFLDFHADYEFVNTIYDDWLR